MIKEEYSEQTQFKVFTHPYNIFKTFNDEMFCSVNIYIYIYILYIFIYLTVYNKYEFVIIILLFLLYFCQNMFHYIFNTSGEEYFINYLF